MTTSYTRNCKVCGRRINLRKMPNGQWVAFEGYDTLHHHETPAPRSTPRTGAANNRDRSSAYDPIGFDNISLESNSSSASGANTTPTTIQSPRISQPTRAGYHRPDNRRSSASASGSESVANCLLYLILGGIALALLKSCTGN